jgi:DNA-binding response OmpR family regulator
VSATRCLVFTDDAAIEGWLRDVLDGVGARVFVAPDAERGLELLRRHGPFDVAFATLSWPTMSALAWARQARAEGFTTPIVLLAPYADGDLKAQVRAIGEVVLADKFLTEDELLGHVERIRSRALAAVRFSKIKVAIREECRPGVAPIAHPKTPPPTRIPRHPA